MHSTYGKRVEQPLLSPYLLLSPTSPKLYDVESRVETDLGGVAVEIEKAETSNDQVEAIQGVSFQKELPLNLELHTEAPKAYGF